MGMYWQSRLDEANSDSVGIRDRVHPSRVRGRLRSPTANDLLASAERSVVRAEVTVPLGYSMLASIEEAEFARVEEIPPLRRSTKRGCNRQSLEEVNVIAPAVRSGCDCIAQEQRGIVERVHCRGRLIGDKTLGAGNTSIGVGTAADETERSGEMYTRQDPGPRQTHPSPAVDDVRSRGQEVTLPVGEWAY